MKHNLKRLFLFLSLTLVLSSIPVTSASAFITQSCCMYPKKYPWPTYKLQFSNPILYQGDPGSVNIQLTSHSVNFVVIKWIGFQFSWMDEDSWISKESHSELKRNDTADFGFFEFNIPSNTDVDELNFYRIKISYDEERLSGWTYDISWTVSNRIFLHDKVEKKYNELGQTVLKEINNAQEDFYISGDARALLSRAFEESSRALILAEQKEWIKAFESLESTQNIAQKIGEAESNYRIVLLSSISIGVIIVLAFTRYLRKHPLRGLLRKKRHFIMDSTRRLQRGKHLVIRIIITALLISFPKLYEVLFLASNEPFILPG